MTTTHSPQFRRALSSIARGDRLIAPIKSYLYRPDFPEFTVQVGGLGGRAPDFFFHPSEHPGWNERSLYLWMRDPTLIAPEPMDPTAILSMTAGSIWHSIIGHIVMEIGLVTGVEVPVLDLARRTRGKMDGVMVGGDEIFELKTAKDSRLRMFTDADEYLRLNPSYHLQANEYMRMSGIHRERVLVMSLTFPYEMKEFVIEYDHRLGQQTAEKYERVLQAVADGRPPMCDGCGKKGSCPARFVCQAEMAA